MDNTEGKWRIDKRIDLLSVITLFIVLGTVFGSLNYRAKQEAESSIRLTEVEKLAASTAAAMRLTSDNQLQITVLLKEQRLRCDEDHTSVKAFERARWGSPKQATDN